MPCSAGGNEHANGLECAQIRFGIISDNAGTEATTSITQALKADTHLESCIAYTWEVVHGLWEVVHGLHIAVMGGIPCERSFPPPANTSLQESLYEYISIMTVTWDDTAT